MVGRGGYARLQCLLVHVGTIVGVSSMQKNGAGCSCVVVISFSQGCFPLRSRKLSRGLIASVCVGTLILAFYIIATILSRHNELRLQHRQQVVGVSRTQRAIEQLLGWRQSTGNLDEATRQIPTVSMAVLSVVVPVFVVHFTHPLSVNGLNMVD